MTESYSGLESSAHLSTVEQQHKTLSSFMLCKKKKYDYELLARQIWMSGSHSVDNYFMKWHLQYKTCIQPLKCFPVWFLSGQGCHSHEMRVFPFTTTTVRSDGTAVVNYAWGLFLHTLILKHLILIPFFKTALNQYPQKKEWLYKLDFTSHSAF